MRDGRHERSYLVVVVGKDSGGSTVVEEMDWGGLLDMVGGYWGLGGRGVLVGVWKD